MRRDSPLGADGVPNVRRATAGAFWTCVYRPLIARFTPRAVAMASVMAAASPTHALEA